MFIVAVLHNIRSLHNVGSIFRTADGAGVKKLYLCGITPSPFDEFGRVRPQIAKVALGAEKTVPWEKCGFTERSRATLRLINRLKIEGYKILAVERAKNAVPYNKVFSKGTWRKIALIFGNEVRGLPKTVLNQSDKIIEIPMFGHKKSLNVSVAFGVAVYGLLNCAEKRKRGN